MIHERRVIPAPSAIAPFLSAIVLGALLTDAMYAQDRNWLSPAGNSQWSNPLNWVPTGAPLSRDTIVIGELQTRPTVELDRDDTIAELQILNRAQLSTAGNRLVVNGPTSMVGDDSAVRPALIVGRGNARTDFVADSLVALAGSHIVLEGGVIEVNNGLLMLDQTSELRGNGTINLTQTTDGIVFDNHGAIRGSNSAPLNINSTNGGQIRLANPNGTLTVLHQLNITGQAAAGNHLLQGSLEIGFAPTGTVSLDETLLVDGGRIRFLGPIRAEPGDRSSVVGPAIDVREGFIFGEGGVGEIRARTRMMGNSVIGAFPNQTLQFFEPVEFTGTGNVVDNTGQIHFTGGVNVADGSVSTFDVSSLLTINDFDDTTNSIIGDTRFTGAGTLVWNGRVVVNGDVVVDSERFLWGGTGAETSINPNDSLTINASRLSPQGNPNNLYSGTATLGANSVLSVNTDVPWGLVGTMEMRGATVNGVNITVGSDTTAGLILTTDGNNNRINPTITVNEMGNLNVGVGSTLILQGEANFETGSSSTIDGTLRLQAFTRFRGGSFTGGGTIDQNGDARFIEDTTIDLDPQTGVYDMDSLRDQDTSILINPGKSVSITANRINTADNTFSGEITIDSGSLTINTEDPWTMRGSLTMIRQPGQDPTLDGSPIIIEGALAANGASNHIASAVFFMDSAQVTVPTGVLRLRGPRTEFHGGSYTGEGEIHPSEVTVVVLPTTIETNVFNLDGSSEITTTVSPEGHLILNVGSIDDIVESVPQFDGNLTLFGGDLTINQSDSRSWATSALSVLSLDGTTATPDFMATPDLNGQPVTLQGIVNVSNGLARINVPATLQADPNASPGVGVQTVTVNVFADSELEFNDTVNIEGGEFDGEGTITFNKSATIAGPVSAEVGGIQIGQQGSVEMSDGEVTTTNFTKHAHAGFALRDGTFRIRGGTGEFNSSFSFGGPSANEQPIFRVEQGADASVTFSFQIAPAAGHFATAVVNGTDGSRPSTVRGTGGGAGADVIVGGAGDGSLVVSAGGLVDLRDDLIIGRHDGGMGEVNVRDVENGFRATIDVTGGSGASIQIGGGDDGGAGVGVLNIENGGFVQTSADVMLARFADAEAFVTVRGQAQGFPAELDVADDIFVGGTGSTPGGTTLFTIDEGGLVRADGMIVWQDGTVLMHGGDLWLNRLNLETGGGDFQLLGGTLHADDIAGDVDNQGGTIDPGDSPGTMTISGDYTQGLNGTLRIELGGTTPGDQYDQLHLGGVATLAGTLAVELYDEFFPSAGQSFEIVTAAGGIVGMFDVLNLPDVDSPLLQEVNYSANSVTLDYSLLALLEGDYDNSGGVEQGDLDLVLLNWGESATPTPDGWVSDLPSGSVDQDELDKVLLNWGLTAAPSGASPVPEPSALLLFATSITAALALRIMRRRSMRQ